MWLSDFHLYNPRVQYYKLLFIVLLHTHKKKLVKYQNVLLALAPNWQIQLTGAPKFAIFCLENKEGKNAMNQVKSETHKGLKTPYEFLVKYNY